MPGNAHEDRLGRRAFVAEMQEALLPAALPVLPRARIAARYLVAGHEQAAGGDWFDAIPLADGSVALVVGDVVGHGVAASAAMGQLRAVLAELLAAEADLGRVLEQTDAFAARMPRPCGPPRSPWRCSTRPPGSCATHLRAPTAAGHRHRRDDQVPGGHRDEDRWAPARDPSSRSVPLAPGELVLRYTATASSNGRTRPSSRGWPNSPRPPPTRPPAGRAGARRRPAVPERVCQLTVERLTRTGHADDVTALAAQRLADPVPALHLELPGDRASLTTARDAFAGWLKVSSIPPPTTGRALHLAMVEVFTNAIEHAYPLGEPGIIEFDAILGDDGNVECRVTDHGTWRRPDPADSDRGHGLMVAGQVVDHLLVSHPPQAAGAPAGPGGTIVTMRHRLRRPAVLASGQEAAGHNAAGHNEARAARRAEPPFTVDTSTAERGMARMLVCGPVDITTADQLARRLLSVSRGGTVPLVVDLTGVTQLASAGVRALYAVSEQMAAHAQDLTLITAPGSAVHMVLDLVRLAHVAAPAPLDPAKRR